jgi:hypothetical protein
MRKCSDQKYKDNQKLKVPIHLKIRNFSPPTSNNNNNGKNISTTPPTNPKINPSSSKI